MRVLLAALALLALCALSAPSVAAAQPAATFEYTLTQVTHTSSPLVPVSAFDLAEPLIAADAATGVVVSVSLPFPVSVYGHPRSSLWVGQNGALNMDNSCIPVYVFLPFKPEDNDCPSSTPLNTTFILPFNPDMDTDPEKVVLQPAAGVYQATVGTAPNRQYVIWWNTFTSNDPHSNISVQVVFSEASDIIEMRYGADLCTTCMSLDYPFIDSDSNIFSVGVQGDTNVYTEFQGILASNSVIYMLPPGANVPTDESSSSSTGAADSSSSSGSSDSSSSTGASDSSSSSGTSDTSSSTGADDSSSSSSSGDPGNAASAGASAGLTFVAAALTALAALL